MHTYTLARLVMEESKQASKHTCMHAYLLGCFGINRKGCHEAVRVVLLLRNNTRSRSVSAAGERECLLRERERRLVRRVPKNTNLRWLSRANIGFRRILPCCLSLCACLEFTVLLGALCVVCLSSWSTVCALRYIGLRIIAGKGQPTNVNAAQRLHRNKFQCTVKHMHHVCFSVSLSACVFENA